MRGSWLSLFAEGLASTVLLSADMPKLQCALYRSYAEAQHDVGFTAGEKPKMQQCHMTC